MNILMFGWELPPRISGGLGVACAGLMGGLAEHAMSKVIFVMPNGTSCHTIPSAQIISTYAQHSCEVGSSPKISSRSAYDGVSTALALDFAVSAAQLFPKFVPDIIHAHDWMTFPAAIAAQRWFGCPLVVHIHSTEFDRASDAGNTAIHGIELEGLKKANRVIAVSQATRRDLIEKYDINPSKVVVAYNGVKTDAFYKVVKTSTRQGGQVVLFAGRLTQQKGPRYFIDAAKLVLARYPDTLFIVAGEGELLAMLKALARVHRIDSQIRFPGFLSRTEIESVLSMTDVYVMPSLQEPFGIGALEAICAEVPVVLSESCGVCEVVDDLIKVPAGDVGKIAEGILFCLSDPVVARQKAARAAEMAKVLTWAACAKHVLEVYNELIQEMS